MRPLRPRDEQELPMLHELLQVVNLSPGDSDTLIWTPLKKGCFSVKSFSLELTKSDVICPQKSFASLWKGLVPYRVEIFVWLALQQKLNTKDKLCRFGIMDPSLMVCTLCNSALESCEYIFLHCSLARDIWCWWLNIWHLHWCMPLSLFDAYEQWVYPKSGSFFRKVWKACFFVILWTLWREQNNRIFDDISCPLPRLRDLILLRISWWIKGWGFAFPYDSIDIVRNPSCLNW